MDEDIIKFTGGIPARSEKGERLLLFLGVIDILQQVQQIPIDTCQLIQPIQIQNTVNCRSNGSEGTMVDQLPISVNYLYVIVGFNCINDRTRSCMK